VLSLSHIVNGRFFRAVKQHQQPRSLNFFLSQGRDQETNLFRHFDTRLVRFSLSNLFVKCPTSVPVPLYTPGWRKCILESGGHSTKTIQQSQTCLEVLISYVYDALILSRAVAAQSHSFYKFKIRLVHGELKKTSSSWTWAPVVD